MEVDVDPALNPDITELFHGHFAARNSGRFFAADSKTQLDRVSLQVSALLLDQSFVSKS